MTSFFTSIGVREPEAEVAPDRVAHASPTAHTRTASSEAPPRVSPASRASSSLTVLMARCHVAWAGRYEPLLAGQLESRYRAQGVL